MTDTNMKRAAQWSAEETQGGCTVTVELGNGCGIVLRCRYDGEPVAWLVRPVECRDDEVELHWFALGDFKDWLAEAAGNP